MFRYINIESYRGLNHVVLEELNRVNIIVGDNNSGTNWTESRRYRVF